MKDFTEECLSRLRDMKDFKMYSNEEGYFVEAEGFKFDVSCLCASESVFMALIWISAQVEARRLAQYDYKIMIPAGVKL